MVTEFIFDSLWNFDFQTISSTSMEKIVDLHNDIMFFLIFVIVFISWMLLRIIWLFRSSNKKTLRFSFQHHSRLEQIWTIIPAIILFLIASPSYALLYSLEETINFNPRITIHATGNQWYWSYNYPDFLANLQTQETLKFDSYMITEKNLPFGGVRLLEVDNIVHLPLETPIRVLVTSRDVIHSWALPSFGIKMDACPGRINQTVLFIIREGIFFGQCSELCGVQHAFMPIAIKVETMDKFIHWININKIFDIGNNWLNKNTNNISLLPKFENSINSNKLSTVDNSYLEKIIKTREISKMWYTLEMANAEAARERSLAASRAAARDAASYAAWVELRGQEYAEELSQETAATAAYEDHYDEFLIRQFLRRVAN